MKHLFNDISKSEKDRILEMHGTKKSILRESFDFSKIIDAITSCASDNNITVPQACKSLTSGQQGGDMNPNALVNCIKGLKTVANPGFFSCVKEKSGVDISSGDIKNMLEKGVETLKNIFGGGNTPWDEKF
jgi:hypothetical protein